jgi:hypothetical protein
MHWHPYENGDKIHKNCHFNNNKQCQKLKVTTLENPPLMC